jgi:putative membrane protein
MTFPALALAAAVSGAASAQSTAPSSHSAMAHDTSGHAMSASDRAFLEKAAQGGLAEVELGKLAAEKGSTPEVKAFGQQMVDDHGKANAELKTLAESKGITVPTELSSKDAQLRKKLDGLSGSAFDHAYVAEMVKDHKHDVAEFEKESKKAHDPDVAGFASKTLPTLRQHLTHVENLSKSVHASAAGNNKPASKKTSM